jgi:hypothetical protein
MPLREKDRKRHRRQRRKKKLSKLKGDLADTRDVVRRRKLEEKIGKLQPGWRQEGETE